MNADLDPVVVRALAEELDVLVAAVPGVLRVQPRLGVSRFAKRVIEGLASVVPGAGPQGPGPKIGLSVSGDEVFVELDVAVAHDHSGPAVVRAVAAVILERLALEGLPEPRVDVRIVAVG